MLNLRELFRQYYPSGLRTLYVSASGNDLNSGLSNSSPKSSVQAAISMSRAGDRIVIGQGTYGYTQFYDVHGSAQAWITIESAPGTVPVIDVSTSRTSFDPSKMNDGIDIQLSSNVAIYGLEIRGSEKSTDPNPSGVAIFRRSSHIAIWACQIHDFPGGGINCFYTSASAFGRQILPAGGWDAVDVFFNTIHRTSKFSPFNTSGVSFYGAQDLTGTTIDGRYGYRAVGNYIYDVVCTVPYTPGGSGNITDGNGISPDSLAIPNTLNPHLVPYLKRGLIEGNVITACGGRGVHIFNTKNIDVVNNTLVGNLRTNSPYINGSSEVDVQLDGSYQSNGIVIANNLIAPTNTARSFELKAQTITGNTALGGTDPIPAGNQSLRSIGLGLFATVPTPGALASGMSLAALTPAINTWVPRPLGSLGFEVLGLGQQTSPSIAVGALQRH